MTDRGHGRALLRAAVRFGRELRQAGLGGDLSAAIDFARALTLIDIGRRDEARAAGAALFVRRHDELPAYHEVFDRFWRGFAFNPVADSLPALRRPDAVVFESDAADADDELDQEGQLVRRVGYSPQEVLRHRSFDQMTADELREAERLIDRLAPHVALRRTRRSELHPHGRLLAPRAMLRRNLASGAEPLSWVWRRSVRQPRPVAVLCDISGSMERHARLLLRFVHALGRVPLKLEVFVFGTQLTRVTRMMRERHPDRALERVTEAARDWSGGTRIGDSFRAFNLRWARRVLPTSGVVIVLSDGWDRGDPERVRAETARLQRNCHRLVWLNPLAAADGYEPLAAGMAAARPSIDVFLPAASVANLEELGALLAGAEVTGRAA